MEKPHSVEVREHAVKLVKQGNRHPEAAKQLCVSIKFINDMVLLRRETSVLALRPQDNPRKGKLAAAED